ncbi:hypothetical protein DIPPA_30119 [Diplonema papillatum]|nr:hypothetical protein DIPPA_30119 [Diplonema papillatum]
MHTIETQTGVDVMCAADVADNDVFRGSINTEKWELCFRRREDLGNGGSVIEQQSFRQESGSITLWAKQGWDLIDAKRHEYSMFSRQETVAVLLRRPEAGANFAASDYVFVVNANVSVPPGTVRVFMGGDTVGSLGDILGRTEPNCLRVQLKHSRQVITVPATCVREAGLDNELDVLDAFCSGEITRYTEKLTGRSQRTAVTTARFPVVLCIHLDAEPSASTYRRCLGLFHRVGVQLAPAHDADAKVARDYIFCNRKAFDVVSTSNTMCARSLPIPEVPSDHMPISATVRHRCSLLGIS